MPTYDGPCEAFLLKTSDRECAERFLSLLPQSVKGPMQTALDAVAALAQIERALSVDLEALLNIVLQELDEFLAAIVLIFQPILSIANAIAGFLLPFAICPFVSQLATTVLSQIIWLTRAIRSSDTRKQFLRDLAVGDANGIAGRLIQGLQEFPLGQELVTTFEEASEALDGIRSCVGAVGQIQLTPGNPIDQLADTIGENSNLLNLDVSFPDPFA